MALSSADRRRIHTALDSGKDSFAEIGRRYGVSREYIRQLANEEGITGQDRRRDIRHAVISLEAEFLVEDREQYVPPRWSERVYTRAQFELWLGINDKPLLKRWKAAQKLPLSRSGHASPTNQRCTDCGLWLPWSEFYSDTSRVYGKSSRCQDCAKIQARASYAISQTHYGPGEQVAWHWSDTTRWLTSNTWHRWIDGADFC